MRDTLVIAPRLATPRLELRPIGPEDIDALVDGIGNYEVTRWLSRVPYPYTHAHATAYLDGAVGDGLTWGVDAGSGLIGAVSIGDELGYWLARPVWGRGYGFEAVRAVVEHWFGDPVNGDLRAGYFSGNDRSGLVLSCLGFRPDGVVEKSARALAQTIPSQQMRLTRADWEAVSRFDVSTERLRLRELKRSDAHALVALTTPRVARMVSSIPETFTTASAKAFINKRRWQGVPGFLLAIDGPDGEMIGCIGCGGTPVTAMIFLGEAYWSKGYGSEAAGAFIAELFRRFPLATVHAEHFTDNPASGEILRKLGFERIGEHPGTSQARLEPAPVVEYRLTRSAHQARS